MGRSCRIRARPSAYLRALCVAALVCVTFAPAVARAAGVALPRLTSSATPLGAGSLLSLPVRSTAVTPAEPIVFVEPPYADAWFGWRRSPTTVRVVTAGERVLYRWDSDVGPWDVAEGAIPVPEGRHVLHLATVSRQSDGTRVGVSWRRDIELKVGFSSPKLRPPTIGVRTAARLTATDAVVVNVTVKPVAGPTLVRLGGRNRYETAAAISKYNFPSASTVILATGEDFADALSSSGMAGSYDAPLLLTNRSSLPAATLAEMRRLGAKTCIIAGGTAAVSSGVEQKVKASGFAVKRLGGADRYATAALIAMEIERREGKASLVFLARGDNFPDALAVSPFAYEAACPIVLTRPSALPDASRQILARGYVAKLVIAGGPAAVSSGVENEVRGYAGAVSRAGGSDRYETAVKAAHAGMGLGLSKGSMVGLATGENFPDALCGGAVTGKQGGIILLTRKATLPMATGRLLGDLGTVLRHVQVYGGTAAVSDSVVDAVRSIIHW